MQQARRSPQHRAGVMPATQIYAVQLVASPPVSWTSNPDPGTGMRKNKPGALQQAANAARRGRREQPMRFHDTPPRIARHNSPHLQSCYLATIAGMYFLTALGTHALAQHIYWRDGKNGIQRADLDGTDVVNIVPKLLECPLDITIDADASPVSRACIFMGSNANSRPSGQ